MVEVSKGHQGACPRSRGCKNDIEGGFNIHARKQGTSSVPQGVDEGAPFRGVGKEHDHDQLFEAIAPNVQIIRLQMEKHELRESSPSRKALGQILDILRHYFLSLNEPFYNVSLWWLQDTSYMSQTLRDAVRRLQGTLSSNAIDALQTLGDYIVKWYAPEGLAGAAEIYLRIINQLDSEPASTQDARRPHVVKELARIYVDPQVYIERSEDHHCIILQGLAEMKRLAELGEGAYYDLVQFYQDLGAVYVHRYGNRMGLQDREKEGEEILRCTHEIQKQLFGSDDYRSVKTVDILSWYYSRVAREVEAASLIQSVLRPRDTLRNVFDHASLGIAVEDDKGPGGYDDCDNNNNNDHNGGGDDDNYEGPGDEKKRRALEEWKDSITDSGSKDNFYARLKSLLAPPSYVWEDSRLCVNDIDEIQWTNIEMADRLENYPICMILKNREVRVQVPMASFVDEAQGRARVAALIRSVEESHFYAFLKSGTAAGDDGIAPEMRGSKPDLTDSDIKHTFWAFPREVVGAEWQSLQHHDGLGDTKFGRGKIEVTYQFREMRDRPEWLVVVTHPATPEKRMMFGQERLQHLGWTTLDSSRLIENPAQTWLPKDDLKYSISHEEDAKISLICPYISCTELRKLNGFGWGFKYVDFVQQLRLDAQYRQQKEAILAFKEGLCRHPYPVATKIPMIVVDEAREYVSDESRRKRTRISCEHHTAVGFFNHIPGDSVLASHEEAWQGFNLVSSTWPDWETFVVNSDLPEDAYPKLESGNGEPIKCRGTIRGQWIPSSLAGSYLVEEVFVVDAVFTSAREPGREWDFMFSAETFHEKAKIELKAGEKRLLIGALNPSFFTYINPEGPQEAGAAWWKKDKVPPPKELTLDEKIFLHVEKKEKYQEFFKQEKKRWAGDLLKIAKLEEDYKLQEKEWQEFDKSLALVKKNLQRMPL